MSALEKQGAWTSPFAETIEPDKGKLIVLFRTVPKYMRAQSEEKRRAVYEERTHITIIVPGDKGLVLDHEVKETDKQRFPLEWANWERTRQNKTPGIPIEHWHALTDTQKMEFKMNQVHTVEQLAGLDDLKCQNYMGGLELRAKARTFVNIEKSEDAAKAANARADALEVKLAELQAMVEQLTAPKAK